MASFWKPEACGQTEIPDRLVSIGQKLVENAKIQKFKCDILSNFQTLYVSEGAKKSIAWKKKYQYFASSNFGQNLDFWYENSIIYLPILA